MRIQSARSGYPRVVLFAVVAYLADSGLARGEIPSPQSVAQAQPVEAPEPPPAPSVPDNEEAVDRHVQQASEHFSGGRYDDSVRSLQAAYKLDPQPIFLFNIAQSFRRGQRLKDALALYGRFLSVDPRTSLRAETRGYIQELTVLIGRQEQIERERRRPVWRKAWFWGLVGSGAALAATGLGLGLGLGLRDDRAVIDLR